jgi:hypothetical protein
MMRRWLTIALALAAASMFAVSVQAGRWWSIGDFEVGPFGSRNCLGGNCHATGLSWLGGTERWARTGVATWAGAMLAMLVLVAVAGAIAAKRTPRLLAKTALVAVLTAALAGTWFVIQFPAQNGASLGVDRGLFLFYGGAALGLAAAINALRLRPLPR